MISILKRGFSGRGGGIESLNKAFIPENVLLFDGRTIGVEMHPDARQANNSAAKARFVPVLTVPRGAKIRISIFTSRSPRRQQAPTLIL
jgi:hypothetical protein